MDYNTITVGELKELLEPYSDDTPVCAVSNYGDRLHTMQLIQLGDTPDEFPVYETAYSESGYAVDLDGERDEDRCVGSVLVLNP